MGKIVKTEKVYPQQLPKTYDIEVYVSFNGSYVHVTAGVIGAQYPVTMPSGDNVKRYVFTVEAPKAQSKSNNKDDMDE